MSSHLERIVGIGCFIIALIFFFMSFELAFIQDGNASMGPGFFPRIIAGIFVILSAIYVFQLFKQKLEKRKQPMDRIIILKQITLVISLCLCIVLSNIIGMLFSIGLFLLFTLAIVQRIDWKISIGLSVLMVAIMYVLFEIWLGISLPKGTI